MCVCEQFKNGNIYVCVCVFGAERERMRDGERVKYSLKPLFLTVTFLDNNLVSHGTKIAIMIMALELKTSFIC